MLQLLERRLDNIVYRAGWASTRPRRGSSSTTATSRSTVGAPTSPATAGKGDVVSLRGKARQMIQIQWNRDVLSRTPPPWLDSENEGCR